MLGRVLVAEDNPVNQKVAARMLERLGYAADIVGTGQEALAAAGRQTYVAIFMDGQMPGMDGFEAATRISAPWRPAARRTPIIALTASAMRGDRERCLAAGMDDYLTKPVGPEQLGHGPRPLGARGGGRAASPVRPEAAVTRVRGPVDWDVLAELLSVTRPGFVRELLLLFLRDAATALTDLRIAWRDDDLAGWRRVAHKLLGSAATVGGVDMMAVCTRMGELDEDGLARNGEGLLDELEAEFRALQAALRKEERRAGAPFNLDRPSEPGLDGA